ncbi:AAA family ATPase [Salinibacillus xinjiangensis]|uniref:AAA family ATPase n=1 Tax=Salinibacillus xinjiangensis TaxID=1229268 RepID=A0A6G1X4D0_9BACI|nr:AAA family ATPase [Salinibacillus xinjiangensis]MRG85688.1 AAA family ATPase [Salinibacillus xinjiangensis]
MVPNKIHIIGSVGSGKTTLAKKISNQYNIPFFELDNVVWERHASGDIRRSEVARKEYLSTITQTKKWIIEGVHNEEWVTNSFREADIIIFLDPKYSVRTRRIIKRFFKQKLGFEESNYKPTFKIFFKMFKWNRYFEEIGKPNFFSKYEVYRGKIIIVRHKGEIENYLDERETDF